jgi:hypothetical protein
MIMRRVDAGEDVFADLRHYENATIVRPNVTMVRPNVTMVRPNVTMKRPLLHPPSDDSIKIYQTELTQVDQGAVHILLALNRN